MAGALARLQQVTTLALPAAAVSWALWAGAQGRPVLALAGAFLIVFGYAAVLAVEFVLLARAHRDDPAPRASPAQLLRAWWGEVRTSPQVFCWQQPFRSQRWPDHLPADSRGRRGLLLVHGFVCNRGVWNSWLQRLQAQDVPFVAVDLEPVFGAIDDYIVPIEAAVRRLEAATGLAPVAVAHSMGGLALRRWWAESGDDARIHHAVSIGTPHQGTWLARFATTRNARQMAPGCGFLQTLAQREPPGRSARFTCFYSHCDNVVFPATGATLPGADNRHLEGTAHVQMVERSEPFDEVMRWLRTP